MELRNIFNFFRKEKNNLKANDRKKVELEAFKDAQKFNLLLNSESRVKLTNDLTVVDALSKRGRTNSSVNAKVVFRRKGLKKKTEKKENEQSTLTSFSHEPAIVKSPIHLKEKKIVRNNPKTVSTHGSTSQDSNKIVDTTIDSSKLITDLKDMASEMLEPLNENISNDNGKDIDDIDFYDFHQFLFMKRPKLISGTEFFDGSYDLASFLGQIRELIKYQVLKNVDGQLNFTEYIWLGYGLGGEDITYTANVTLEVREQLIENIFNIFSDKLAAYLYSIYLNSDEESRVNILRSFEEWLGNQEFNSWGNPFENDWDNEIENPEIWENALTEILTRIEELGGIKSRDGNFNEEYSFIPYDDKINFGIRLTYRQEWKFLGTQKGELVKSIPLGPKQSEKITTKYVKTKKFAKTVENILSSEKTSDSTVTEKDTSEIIREASKSSGYTVGTDTDVKYNKGVFSASTNLTTEHTGESASGTKDTKTNLNETVEKTVNSVRNENKIIVTTEESETFESTAVSEIYNPNEEIAITYNYHRQNKKYEIYTKLAELNSVVFIPERVPHESEINEQWIKRYDWIIGKNLLDSSFADDLAMIANDIEEPDSELDDKAPFTEMMKRTNENIGNYKDFIGDINDIFSSSAQTYSNQLDKNLARERKNALRAHKLKRLRTHIIKNILHYMRAIWNEEDPQQRMQRYSQIFTPIEWRFFRADDTDFEFSSNGLNGRFEPNPQSLVPVSDIINPSGPIGYAINYAIFYLKGDPRLIELHEALTLMRTPYMKFKIKLNRNEEVVPSTNEVGSVPSVGDGSTTPIEESDIRLIDVVVVSPQWNKAKYTVTITNGEEIAVKVKVNSKIGGQYEFELTNDDLPDIENVFEDENYVIDIEGIKLIFNKKPNSKTYTFYLKSKYELQDPEERLLRVLYPFPEDEIELLVPEIIEHFTELEDLLTNDNEDLLTDADNLEIIKEYYYKYLMKVEYSRKILKDTNNLMIELEKGKVSALEDFKLIHRAVDVLKEIEVLNGQQIENVRLYERLASGDFSDPDTERTIITNDYTDAAISGSISNTNNNQ